MSETPHVDKTPRTARNYVRGFEALRITGDEDCWCRAEFAAELEAALTAAQSRVEELGRERDELSRRNADLAIAASPGSAAFYISQLERGLHDMRAKLESAERAAEEMRRDAERLVVFSPRDHDQIAAALHAINESGEYGLKLIADDVDATNTPTFHHLHRVRHCLRDMYRIVTALTPEPKP